MKIYQALTELAFMYTNVTYALTVANDVVKRDSTTELLEAYQEVIDSLHAALRDNKQYSQDDKKIRYKVLGTVCRLCVDRQLTCTPLQFHVFHGLGQDIDNKLYNIKYDVKGE